MRISLKTSTVIGALTMTLITCLLSDRLPSVSGQDTSDYEDTLHYPDAQSVRVYGTITYTARVDDEKTSKDGITYKANITATHTEKYERNGASDTYDMNGTLTVTYPVEDCDGHPITPRKTTTFKLSKTVPRDPEFSSFSVSASDKMHLVAIAVGPGGSPEGVRVTTHSHGKACGGSSDDDSDAAFADYRVPLHSNASSTPIPDVKASTASCVTPYSPFAQIASRIEAAGTLLGGFNKGMPLHSNTGGVGGDIEAVYGGNGNTSGEFTTQMQVAAEGLAWNTAPVWAAMARENPDSTPVLLNGSLTVSWQLGNGQPPRPSDVKLIVTADNYEKWKPEGGRDEKTPGNGIQITAKLSYKDGKPFDKCADVTFALEGTSTEPGVSLNWPVEGATNDPDLQFDTGSNSGLLISDPKGQSAVSRSSASEVKAHVASYDWGAYGTLKVTAQLSDGTSVAGHLRTESGPTDILLPYRTGDSKIADAWRTEKGVPKGQADDFDGEQQKDNKNLGDGFTLYEEYRGVMATGKHESLLPDKKDLIVEDQLEMLVDTGLDLFNKASDIYVLHLKKGELGTDRIVNANHGYAYGGKQHGLRLVPHHFAVEDGAETLGEEPASYESAVSPKDADEIWISDTLNGLLKTVPKDGQKIIDSTIAHELAHGCGVKHHGAEYKPLLTRSVTDPPWQIYSTAGVRIPPAELPTPNTIDGSVGLPQSVASGNIDCIMIYNHYYSWAMPDGATGHVYAAAPPDDHPGTIFCTSKAGTGWNATDAKHPHPPYPLFGNAEKGDCMSQFQVKDW